MFHLFPSTLPSNSMMLKNDSVGSPSTIHSKRTSTELSFHSKLFLKFFHTHKKEDFHIIVEIEIEVVDCMKKKNQQYLSSPKTKEHTVSSC